MMPLTPKKYFVENVADRKTLKVIKFGLIPIYGSKVMGKKPTGGIFALLLPPPPPPPGPNRVKLSF